jgi:hypothetical protein
LVNEVKEMTDQMIAEQQRLQKIAESIPLRLFPGIDIHVNFANLTEDTFAMLVTEGNSVFVALDMDLRQEKDSRLLQLLFEAFESNEFQYPYTPTRQDFFDMIDFWSLPEIMLRAFTIKILYGHFDPTSGAIIDKNTWHGWKGVVLSDTLKTNYRTLKKGVDGTLLQASFLFSNN